MLRTVGWLKTIVTYDRPSEAEVDKAFLESRGYSVCLLNGNTARNELGPAFYVQLQVSEKDFEAASRILRAANPRRFGSVERVAEIDREMKRMVLFFLAVAIPVGIIAYLLIPEPARAAPVPAGRLSRPFGRIIPDLRIAGSILIAILAGMASAFFRAKKKTDNSTRG